MGLLKKRRKMTKADKTNKPPRKGHATLKKKYQKLCKRECKKEYPIDFVIIKTIYVHGMMPIIIETVM